MRMGLSHIKKGKELPLWVGVDVLGLLVPAVLWIDLSNALVWAGLVVTLGFGAIGYWDDHLKVSKKKLKRIIWKIKIAFRVCNFCCSGRVSHVFWSYYHPVICAIFKSIVLDFGWAYLPLPVWLL